MKVLEMVRKRSYQIAATRLSLLFTVALLSTLYPAVPSRAQTYQGFGANTPGGGGQPLYRVTNLSDSGPGSLRDALSQGNRHIVFDVAGEISLLSRMMTSSTRNIPHQIISYVGLNLRRLCNVAISNIRISSARLDKEIVMNAHARCLFGEQHICVMGVDRLCENAP